MLLPIVVHLLLLTAGLGILRLFGVVRPMRLRTVVAAGGLGYMVGVAVVMQLAVLLLVVGVPFGLPLVALLCFGCAAPLAFDLLRVLARPERPAKRPALAGIYRQMTGETWIAVAVLVAFGALALVGLVTLGNQPIGPPDYDAWNLWGRKASLMFFGSHLPLAVFATPLTGYIHPDYPLVLPLLEALHMRAIGRWAPTSAHTVVWIIAVAFVWAGAFVASRATRPAIWSLLFPGAVLITVTELLSAYADIPMVFYLCLGVLSLGLWIETGGRPQLVVAVLLLSGALGIKNEGLLGAVVALIVAVLVVAARRDIQRLRELVIAGSGVALFAIAPWRIWLAAHHLRGDLPLGNGLDPSFLAHKSDRVWPSVHALYNQLTGVGTIAVFVPVALAVVILRLRGTLRSPAVGFYAATGVLYFLAMVWAYWISPLDLSFHLYTSVGRVYLGIAFIALAAVVQLTAAPSGASESAPALAADRTAPALERVPA